VTQLGPGEENKLVFTGELGPGRYLMVCFLPDANDPEMTPHAFKGMASVFRIQ